MQIITYNEKKRYIIGIEIFQIFKWSSPKVLWIYLLNLLISNQLSISANSGLSYNTYSYFVKWKIHNLEFPLTNIVGNLLVIAAKWTHSYLLSNWGSFHYNTGVLIIKIKLPCNCLIFDKSDRKDPLATDHYIAPNSKYIGGKRHQSESPPPIYRLSLVHLIPWMCYEASMNKTNSGITPEIIGKGFPHPI